MADDKQPNPAMYDRLVEQVDSHYGKSIEALDKKILYISAGTLGLSLTFINNLVDIATARFVWVLILGWFSLTAAIITNIFGFRFVTRLEFYDESIDIAAQMAGMPPYDEIGPDEVTARKRHSKNSEYVESYNKWAFWFLVAGLVTMIAFVSANVALSLQTVGD